MCIRDRDNAGTVTKVAANGAVATTSMLFIIEACLLYTSESLREIEKWFLKFNDIFMEKFWIAYKCSRSEILHW